MLSRDYQKNLDGCLFIVGDNCAVNKRLATLLGVPLVGCASHRLNLALQSMLGDHASDLAQVKELMLKLKTLNLSAQLRFKTHLRPVISQYTRWGLTFSMVHLYLEILDVIKDIDDVQDQLPSPATNRRLRDLLEDLKKFESVSYELQSDKGTLEDARMYFDALIEFRSEFFDYLGAKANQCTTRYNLVASIPPTSNIVERLFSIAKVTLGTQRQALRPITLEMILFLRANNSYWDAAVVNECS
eukprot:jgi/Phyca11/105692/e_gw1.11.241.1